MEENTQLKEGEKGRPDALETLISEAIRLKAEAAKLESEAKLMKAEYANAMKAILSTIDAMGLDSIRSQGYLFYKETRSYVTTPKTIEEKQALFEFLKGKGMFDEMVSVNSQTLQALYKELAEEAVKAGDLEFELPGCGKPSADITLKMKKG